MINQYSYSCPNCDSPIHVYYRMDAAEFPQIVDIRTECDLCEPARDEIYQEAYGELRRKHGFHTA